MSAPVRHEPYVRAVRGGVMPGIMNVTTGQFYALSWSADSIGCAECWAGLSHTGPGWERHEHYARRAVAS